MTSPDPDTPLTPIVAVGEALEEARRRYLATGRLNQTDLDMLAAAHKWMATCGMFNGGRVGVTPTEAPELDIPPAVVHRNLADVLIVSWDDANREWEVSARSDGTAEWSVFEGAEDELDTLMSLGRNVVTGG